MSAELFLIFKKTDIENKFFKLRGEGNYFNESDLNETEFET